MDTRTGEIIQNEKLQKLLEDCETPEHLVELTEDEATTLQAMPPKQRLLHPLAKLDGMSCDDVRKLRNRRKRERRGR